MAVMPGDGSGPKVATAAVGFSDGAPDGFEVKQGGLGSVAQILALSTLCAVLFLTFLDNTVVSVGLANVQSDLHAGVVEHMFASDLAFLQDLYRRINNEGHTRAAVICPNCQHEFAVDLAGGRLGES